MSDPALSTVSLQAFDYPASEMLVSATDLHSNIQIRV
jgi:hypothetical protein